MQKLIAGDVFGFQQNNASAPCADHDTVKLLYCGAPQVHLPTCGQPNVKTISSELAYLARDAAAYIRTL